MRGFLGVRVGPLFRRRGAALVLAASFLAACHSEPGPGAAASSAAGPRDAVPVEVATAGLEDVPVELGTIGSVEPYATVAIKPQVEGQLGRIHFQEGQWVRSGDLLFSIDPRPFEAALRQAEANLARDVAEARTADVDAARRARLFAQGFVSTDENDQVQTRAAALRASVKAAEAALENARLQLQYCSIRAPIDGRVGQLLVHEGNVVKRNDTTLAVIHQIKPVYVAFSLPERDLTEIRRGAAAGALPVRAVVPSAGRADADVAARGDAAGTLTFIDNNVDAATGTVLLKALFDNEDEALWPGQFVDVALTLRVRHDAVVVPAEALQTGQKGLLAYVVRADSTVELREVETAQSLGRKAVVTKGIAAGERVVTDGQIRLVPGATVQIRGAGGGA